MRGAIQKSGSGVQKKRMRVENSVKMGMISGRYFVLVKEYRDARIQASYILTFGLDNLSGINLHLDCLPIQ